MNLPAFYNRLVRHQFGLHYNLKHNNLMTASGQVLLSPEDFINEVPGLKLIHRPDERSNERNQMDGHYMRERAENRVTVVTGKTPAPAMQKVIKIINKEPVPVPENHRTHPFKLRRLASGAWNGYDDNGNTSLHITQGGLVYATRKLARELMLDFRGDWELITCITGEAL
jgi:hypothetical protein